MAFAKVLFYWSTCYLLLKAHSKCPPSFPCRNFTLEFPFADSKDRECGLFPVQGCDSQYGYPTVRIGSGDSPRSTYLILGRKPENRLLVRDFILQTLLTNGSCLALTDVSLINTPSVSFTFSPNLTVFQCLKESYDKKETAEYFKEYDKKECEPITVYYKTPATHNCSATGETRNFPYGCAAARLPKSGHDSGGLINLVTATFVVEWSVSEACMKCYRGEGQCLTDNQNQFYCKQGAHKSRLKLILALCGVIMAAFASTSIILILCIKKKYTILRLFWFETEKSRSETNIELFLKNNGNLAPIRYKYSDIKRMTKSFRNNLGKGGYGSVFKGKLCDGHPVAVKILDESKGNGEEFMNEVASISRTSHVNIVSLLGFCFEGCKRALIYEFMPNGSLEKFTSNATQGGLGWQKLFEIALGIARGLDYLHQGCKTRILHFDIKPHNILLDKDFNPRISDFGIARLCPNRSSIVSMMVARGTIGYIAPEVFCRNFGEVSHKSDVYSYGMMVLEMAGERKNNDPIDMNRSSEIYFPDYIYKQLEMGRDGEDTPAEIMNEDETRFTKRKLIIVGLWCIQTDPRDRPSMTKVIEMLEGKLELLHVPPKPNLSSPSRSAPKFSYAELEEATNNFDPCKELGDGGFGTVYHGNLRDGREVAIKRLYEHNFRRVEQFLNEIKILTTLRHPNLVSLYGSTSRTSRELLLVYEYISNGTVADHLHGDRSPDALLTWPIRMKIA